MNEITEEEYHRLFDDYRSRAAKLVYEYTEKYQSDDFGIGQFFSYGDYTCAYHIGNVPKSFRCINPNDMIIIYHFLDTPCNNVKLSCRKDTICLAKDFDNDKYYLTTHKVGKCPHKRRKS